MNLIFLAFNLFILSSAYSNETNLDYTYESWRINEQFIQFHKYNKEFILVSSKCQENFNTTDFSKSNCLALKSLSKTSFKKLSSYSLKGGKNPGAVICSQVLNGNVVYGLNRYQDQKTFCLFSDDSYISTEALMIYGIKNDK